MSGKRKIDRTEPQLMIVYYVRWSLDVSIEFSEDAFADCYGSERQETEDMLTQMATDELPVIAPLNSKA